jgi:hypothetical protein
VKIEFGSAPAVGLLGAFENLQIFKVWHEGLRGGAANG